ncbi:MAG: response regulator [Endomicrobiales bacterium]|nr:response regulator [Endomicrobiales bacterium]
MNEKIKKLVLAVDDDPDMLWVLQDFIADFGFDVIAVNNGKDALEQTRNNKFDLIILDIAMPVMDGIETLREIKKVNPGQKVIMITAFRDEKMVSDSFKEGALDCIFKPFDLKNFREILGKVVGK